MNVSELARRLKMPTSELLQILPEIGFDIGRRAIKVDPRLVDKIVRAVDQYRRQQRLQQQDSRVREVRFADKNQASNLPQKEIALPSVIVVSDFADLLKVPVVKVIAEMMKNGIMVSLNERIDFETASIISEDLGYKVTKQEAKEKAEVEADEKVRLKDELTNMVGEKVIDRPPVVVVMGHVDHGKTALLDAIRQTNVMGGEHGGITQHIGAYQVEKKNRLITFLDTPGHEAFKSIRSRGSRVADVGIVVIAADDGLREQTMEVIKLVQQEKLPFVIAINKIDKDAADLDRVKKELSEISLIPEDWGGNTVCVPVSAKTKVGINELLDMVLLVADMEQLKADPSVPAKGTIIESHMDKNEGPVATILIQNGTLSTGENVVVGDVTGKIRSMKNYLNENVTKAGPSMPVRILGLKAVPQVGDVIMVENDQKVFKELAKQQKNKISVAETSVFVEEQTEVKSANRLSIILKTDVLSSQEAIISGLSKFNDPEVGVSIIKKGLGAIVESDVMDAKAENAVIVGFNVKASPAVQRLASDNNIDLKLFNIIYRLFELIEEKLKEMLPKEIVRTEVGKMIVKAIFKTEKKSMIVGGLIKVGKIKPGLKVKVLNDNVVSALGEVMEVRFGKQVIPELTEGQECGILYKGDPLIQEGSVLELFDEQVKIRDLQVKK
jgi:translation initiation factor IF-2